MIALIIFGLLLLYSSFYFGIKYFDGKVEQDTYNAALKYDENKKIVRAYNIKTEIGNIFKDGDNIVIEGTVKSDVPIIIKNIKLDDISRSRQMEQSAKYNGNSFKIVVNDSLEGNYLVVSEVEVNNKTVRLEEPIYVK
ncbi:MAG: hypothetical protein K6348_05425 [Deferribacterales bacterium]